MVKLLGGPAENSGMPFPSIVLTAPYDGVIITLVKEKLKQTLVQNGRIDFISVAAIREGDFSTKVLSDYSKGNG